MRTKEKGFIKKTVFLVFAALFAVVVALAGSVIIIYHSQALSTDKLEGTTHTLQVYNAEGTLLTSDTDFQAVHTEELPTHILNAFIAVEDKNFYKHHGLAYPRIARAVYQNLRAGQVKEGASTISQQLIKNTHLSNERTLRRKVREAALAVKLERNFDKQKILEMYLNAIYFGNGCTGLGSAAHFYFGKPAAELTIRESASLAGLIKSPSRYCPITKFENLSYRTNLVLQLMHAQGYLTGDEYENAKDQPLDVIKRETNYHDAAFKAASIASAARLLNQDTNSLITNGIKIYTFLEPQAQQRIIETVTAEDYQILNASGKSADSCIIAATPQGAIKGYYCTNPTLRLAKRNFASAMKPLTVYAPAFELGVVTPASKILDEAYVAGDFNPKNYDKKYHGNVTVREALEQSYNIPAVKVLEYTGLERAASIGKRMGLNLTDNENLTLSLGSTEQGTTFFELLGGYCILANGGRSVTPSFIKRIESHDGKTLWEWTQSKMQVLGEDTCFLLTDILRSGTKKGTSKKLGMLPFDIAAKTGTSERGGDAHTNTDIVNCSFTSETVLLVWAGNVNMSPENDLPEGTTGGGLTSFIARDIQGTLSKSAKMFLPPSSVEERNSEYYSKRFPSAKKHLETETKTSLILKGSISDTGAPLLSFEAAPKNTYEIYKKEKATYTLQEVINGKKGEHTFLDRLAKQGTTQEYYVIEIAAGVKNQSNTVKLYVPGEIHKRPSTGTKQVGRGKSWFF